MVESEPYIGKREQKYVFLEIAKINMAIVNINELLLSSLYDLPWWRWGGNLLFCLLHSELGVVKR